MLAVTEMIADNSLVFWTTACILFLIIEGLTMGLTTIWFSAGALVAIIVAFCGAGIGIQFAAFLIVSMVLLLFTRKIFVNKLRTGSVKTNVDALIGTKALLSTEIKAFAVGKIILNGQEWSAVCENRGDSLLAGEEVEVIRIEGVKAVVRPVK